MGFGHKDVHGKEHMMKKDDFGDRMEDTITASGQVVCGKRNLLE